MSISVGGGTIKELRVGTAIIKEARVGSTLVYSARWDSVPADGMIYNSPNWASGLGHSGFGTAGFDNHATVDSGQTATITGIVFGRDSTELVVRRKNATGTKTTISVDGEPLVKTRTNDKYDYYAIPTSLRVNKIHTITVRPTATQYWDMGSMSFNI